jgi:uncharacterized Zn finger protein
MSFYGWKPYVPVAERRKQAAKKIAKLKKQGKAINPVIIEGRTIARTFWGKSWCKHLESYQDYENRLPRGRTYVCNGSVVDLKIQKGCIDAMVQGSSLYTINISISALNDNQWHMLIEKCAGKIDSVIELLQGKFSKAVMEIIIDKKNGLFPHAHEIKFECSCPDYASMCKHVAATLYGVGARLDEQPEQLFLLRRVNHVDLIACATSSKKIMQPNRSSDNATIDESGLSALFGIEIDTKTVNVSKTKAAANKKGKKTIVPQRPHRSRKPIE